MPELDFVFFFRMFSFYHHHQNSVCGVHNVLKVISIFYPLRNLKCNYSNIQYAMRRKHTDTELAVIEKADEKIEVVGAGLEAELPVAEAELPVVGEGLEAELPVAEAELSSKERHILLLFGGWIGRLLLEEAWSRITAASCDDDIVCNVSATNHVTDS